MGAPSGLACIVQESGKDFGGLLPFACSFPQPPLSRFRQLVKLRAPVVLRTSPMRADVTLLFQLQESRVKRAVIQRKEVSADLLNAPRQPVPVLRPHGLESAQDHKSQRTLPNIGFVAH